MFSTEKSGDLKSLHQSLFEEPKSLMYKSLSKSYGPEQLANFQGLCGGNTFLTDLTATADAVVNSLSFKCNNGHSVVTAGDIGGGYSVPNKCPSGYSKIEITWSDHGLGKFVPFCNGYAQDQVGKALNWDGGSTNTYTETFSCPDGQLIFGAIGKQSGTTPNVWIQSINFYCGGNNILFACFTYIFLKTIFSC
jgi:hypothetical protein